MRVAVIGGGASGMMAAGVCAKNGHSVDLFEANEKLGKKIYITGKGRCNVTNASNKDEILNNIVNNSKFLYSALNAFDSFSTINFFEEMGVPIKIERGNRAFPVSDKSSDIIKALTNFDIKNNVNILLNHKVININKNNDKFDIYTTFGMYNSYDGVICCTGGLTYSATGSKGDGYKFAKNFGHNIIEVKPALVPILLKDSYIKSIEGLSLKNVKLIAIKNGKIFKEFFGEMLFTSNGISGPIALSMSSYINRQSGISLIIDFKPALTNEQLHNRLMRDIKSNREMQTSTLISGLLPKALVEPFLQKCNIDKCKRVKSLIAKEIDNIVNTLKNYDLLYNSVDKLDFGIITSGGVDVREVNPKTMESKLVNGLYFAGEVLDIDALTGGFNLQIAFATGYLAGINI
ncbi:MAG: NAD(P)/FAD-dependent oxidoreductase [Clostridia bacterium]|nr:NAD(P)/FAD-dependent oxidoreductase [Clostridia bacterium]